MPPVSPHFFFALPTNLRHSSLSEMACQREREDDFGRRPDFAHRQLDFPPACRNDRIAGIDVHRVPFTLWDSYSFPACFKSELGWCALNRIGGISFLSGCYGILDSPEDRCLFSEVRFFRNIELQKSEIRSMSELFARCGISCAAPELRLLSRQIGRDTLYKQMQLARQRGTSP